LRLLWVITRLKKCYNTFSADPNYHYTFNKNKRCDFLLNHSVFLFGGEHGYFIMSRKRHGLSAYHLPKPRFCIKYCQKRRTVKQLAGRRFILLGHQVVMLS
jgi:hypothetical protein